MIGYYSTELHGTPMVAFREVQRVLGLETHKDVVSGDDVARLFEAGNYLAICQYNLLDILAEEKAYLMMSGGT